MARHRRTQSTLEARFRSLLTVFALPVDDAEIARSQLAAFSKQIPLLYAILTANAVGLSATHAQSAPLFLTVIVPLVLGATCLMRAVHWRRLDVAALTSAEAVLKLRTTMRLVGVLGVAFTAWSLSLYPYGDAFAKCHVAFYIAMTVIICIQCLMHLRGAARRCC
jgi:predicted signal transduction protein with EAL and GGDEF domain